MKNAPAANSNESALIKRDYNIGKLPPPRGTAIAGVLMYLLLEEIFFLTAEAASYLFGTNNLRAVIHTLEKKYGWEIARSSVPVFPPLIEVPDHEPHPDLDAWELAIDLGHELPDEAIAWAMKPYEGIELKYELAYGLPYAMIQAARCQPNIASWLDKMKSVTSPMWYGLQMATDNRLAEDLAQDDLPGGDE